MELKINEITIPEAIQFNYEELKQELTEKVSMYETMVYTDDQIKLAKSDKANLNKLKKALNDERIRREREYMQPFNDFKQKINEIISIIDKPVAVIDKQVKAFDEKKKLEKLKSIKELFENISDKPEWLKLEQIFSDRWLLASVSMRQVQDGIEGWLNEINSNLLILAELPEYSFESTEMYKSSLDIKKAISEGKRLAEIQKRKEEQERLQKEAEERAKAEAEAKKQAEMIANEAGEAVLNNAPDIKAQEPVEVAQWISFSAKLTYAQAVELREFFERRKIEFKAV
jgi:hypothetical protein